ncbi:uncharacterized protein PHALS_10236 [Plasmopara halstedii]|uniref:Uncharacterized protein n=1 Tax=Plasmopara halstedii TaxID=4781 RepID=A0A0P1AFW6_PLAHL|nr:uncharacterized protein PHALS_10236 [Plasmopara halstedii]CEG40013.1 hypothetical protein PHALS_10236 [Plasmopara halstedii]|eukprot:XP_024576382.1 hypothetical protein PHALS_10236 [Plasmopara halstedii]
MRLNNLFGNCNFGDISWTASLKNTASGQISASKMSSWIGHDDYWPIAAQYSANYAVMYRPLPIN